MLKVRWEVSKKVYDLHNIDLIKYQNFFHSELFSQNLKA